MAIKRPSIEYDRKVLGSIPTVSIFFFNDQRRIDLVKKV